MPFIYFGKNSEDIAQVKINVGNVILDGEILLVENSRNGADYAIYAPQGSTWEQSGNTYTSTLNGQDYWSMVILPPQATNIAETANEFQKYAYVFPSNTLTSWEFDESNSVVSTFFELTVDVKEGTENTMLVGLLPHQWNNLAPGSPNFTAHSYPTVRGQLKMMETNSFTVQNTFHGILPTLPFLDQYSESFNASDLFEKVKLLENDQLNSWTDSYNEGQEMNRLIQTARIAELTGDTVALQKLLTTVRTRLEDWLEYSSGEVAFLFYYNETWSAMLGYPAGHGQDLNINDHHFHWGYFIHAAAFLEQYQPGWAEEWGGMVNLLVRDAASPSRDDEMFPFLRNFSPYAGHCWANGFATFPQGNDQESTSESMQFNSSLIHWGEVTNNTSIRDLGIYLYTTEQTAVEEYWFDMYERNFGPNQQYSLVSRVWGNSYDNGTFWTADIAASYGIELYPIHGGSLYLGHDTAYVDKLWTEIEQNTGILDNEPNVNLWHDVMWQYLAFIDPAKALELYESYPDRSLKFGVSDAQTYHWLHAMNVLGKVCADLTADHPLAAAFMTNGDTTYVAQNYGDQDMNVVFSNGYVLEVPAKELATSKDIDLQGQLTSSFNQAYLGGSVELELVIAEGTASKVEFYKGDNLLATSTQAPFVATAENLSAGRHTFLARMYQGEAFNLSNMLTVIVGDQLPYTGSPIALPGNFQAAHYDIFEGGIGNGIAYQDMTAQNEGNFRENEHVDAQTNATEGNYVGWVAGGEWLEFTVDVQQAGNYQLVFRYASGNSAGGGPLRIESDGQTVKSDITVGTTGNWNTWASKTVGDIPLKSGQQVLRLYFEGGEFNIAKLTFAYSSPLAYSQPIANAGNNQIVLLPQSSTQLDGTASTDPDQGELTYLWRQVYGPTTLVFNNNALAEPTVSALEEGIYLMELKVDNGDYSDTDEMFIISSNSPNVAPTVSIFSPSDQSVFLENDEITITALASDLNDPIAKVEFWVNEQRIGTSTQAPYEAMWSPEVGSYSLKAIAFDNFGDSSSSAAVSVLVDPAPPCEGTSWNGDFNYRFSPADDNPTITFIPSQPGVGSPTCILYYGTDPGGMPGYNVVPNVPFQINASEGTRIYFYYTYSFPNFGERNNSANPNNYVIGSCQTETVLETTEPLSIQHYPNPVQNWLTINFPLDASQLRVYSTTGQLLLWQDGLQGIEQVDLSALSAGLYIVRVSSAEGVSVFKIMKSAE